MKDTPESIQDKWSEFPIGTKVRCAQTDFYTEDVARRLRNRTGYVKSRQAFTGTPIIVFPPNGRRHEYQWVPSHPSRVEIVKGEPT